MDLTNVIEVREARDADSANAYLKAGWKLLAVVTSARKEGALNPCYVVGRLEGMPELEDLPSTGFFSYNNA